MKKYTAPEIVINNIRAEDIITTSMSLPIVPLIAAEDERESV